MRGSPWSDGDAGSGAAMISAATGSLASGVSAAAVLLPPGQGFWVQ